MPKRRSAKPKTLFAARLIAVREAYGEATRRKDMDQKGYARIIGFGDGQEETYRRYERGETEPSLRTLAEIHKVTGADLNDLIGEDPSAFRQAEPKRSKQSVRTLTVAAKRAS